MTVAVAQTQATLVGAAWFSDEPRQLVDFYQRVLGLSFERRAHDDGRVHWICDVAGVHVEIKAARTTQGAPTSDAGTGALRSSVELSWQVADVDAATELALAHGATLQMAPVTHPWGRWAVVLDPQGNPLGLYAAPASSSIPATSDGVS